MLLLNMEFNKNYIKKYYFINALSNNKSNIWLIKSVITNVVKAVSINGNLLVGFS